MENEIKITVKWSGEEYSITDIQENDTVLSLKEKIQKMTGVRPERQKLLNLKFKGYTLY
jgi:ubiquitin-like domain-containing CTD phosphatase 1